MDFEAHVQRLASIVTLEPSRKAFQTEAGKVQIRDSHQVQYQHEDSLVSTDGVHPQLSSSHSETSSAPVGDPKGGVQGGGFDWRINPDTVKTVLRPILRRMLLRFDEHDSSSEGELRLTILVSHRFGGGEKGDEWKGAQCPVVLDFTKFFEVFGRDDEERRMRGVFFELYEVWVFGEYLPEIPKAPILVDIIEAERNNPTVKHVDWTSDRKKLEREGSQNANEMLLVDHAGHIYEGLSSNFVVIMNAKKEEGEGGGAEVGEEIGVGGGGSREDPSHVDMEKEDSSSSGIIITSSSDDSKNINISLEDRNVSWLRTHRLICTAPNHTVLNGTIRGLMLQSAREHQLNISFECPTIQQLRNGEWLACALMSTSRLLLPITQINILKTKDEAVEKKDEPPLGAGPSNKEPPPRLTEQVTSNSSNATTAATIIIPTTPSSSTATTTNVIPNARSQSSSSTMLPTSSHYIDASFSFDNNEPTIAFLQQAIIHQMLLSSTNMRE